MKLLITGASGLLGINLAMLERLAREGFAQRRLSARLSRLVMMPRSGPLD